jgi:hypothetical protein
MNYVADAAKFDNEYLHLCGPPQTAHHNITEKVYVTGGFSFGARLVYTVQRFAGKAFAAG